MAQFSLDLDRLPRYPTMRELERLTGRPARWVQRQLRYLALKPALLKGERQVTQADALRLVLLSHLQRCLGETSPTPRLLVEHAASAINDLLQNPHAGTVIALNENGTLNVVVGVPSLQTLLTVS
jgi:hypothetical protein